MGGLDDGAIARVVCLRGRIGVTASGQLVPTMNDVGISAICYGELGALHHHLYPRHRVVPLHARLLTCHRVQLKLDAHDPYFRAGRNQDDKGDAYGERPRSQI